MNLYISNSKKFTLILLVSSVFIFLTTILCLEVFIRNVIIPNDNLIKYTQLFFEKEVTEVALGDSHVAYGFTHPIMLNLAYPSDNIALIEIKIKNLTSRNNINKVILQADPHLFSKVRLHSKVDKKIEFFEENSAKFTPLMAFDPFYKDDILYYIKTFVTKMKFQNKTPINLTGAQLSEFEFSSKASEKIEKETQFRVNKRFSMANPQKQSREKDRYINIVNLLTNKKIDVCLVSFPTTKVFKKYYDPRGDPIINFYKKIATNSSIKYLDYRTYKENDLSYFKDSDHLNKKGATNFSKKIYKECFQ